MNLEKTIYIQIFKNKVRVYCLDTKKEEWIDDLEFSNERLLVGTLDLLQKRVKKAFINITKKSFFSSILAPTTIVHPMMPDVKELCEIEIQIFKGVASLLVIGQNVIVYLGETLEDEQIFQISNLYKNKSMKEREKIVTIEDIW